MNVVSKTKSCHLRWRFGSTDRPVNLGTPAILAFAVIIPFDDSSPYVWGASFIINRIKMNLYKL